ncbi:dUTP diphosphatase [Salimicrobium album]|uniref:Dimeric dUTPase, all-alpha-NTP-PPase (MazG) superfamily n=1 Tax=Salimicrobium album TaxID=50717 RepID=A0A1H3DDX9_9BACI|nr:dUTP diphosphatase [Salimicrobium album]SDX64338.1 Dimeric dUTPase, all-alpha-NTP-PPase (MazG) superfamily [Salimicrobium album]
MNLSKLYNIQGGLDYHIGKEKGFIEGENMDWKVLALHTEIGELANEWRGFKKWSNDQEPRREKMLEEYVDCLHFVLSIGLEKGYRLSYSNIASMKADSITEQFNALFRKVGDFSQFRTIGNYNTIFDLFLSLGEMLGFTEDEIEEAYLAKNKINHNRQLTGY